MIITIRRQFIRGYAVAWRIRGEAVSQSWAELQVARGLAGFVPELGDPQMQDVAVRGAHCPA